MIYADYAASSPMLPEALETLARLSAQVYGNPSSLHSFGEEAAAVLDDARRKCAGMIGAEPDEILFTSGGTEADNLALRGAPWKWIAVSAAEHPAVLRTVESLEKQGTTVMILPVNASGETEVYLPANASGAGLVSVMLANNETGVIQPVKEMAALAHSRGALFHCDAVQGAGHIPIDVKELGADLMSVSAHKLGGPKGIGFLWIRRGIGLSPVLTGGGQEHGLRSGTESVPLIGSFGEACSQSVIRMNGDGLRLTKLRDRIERELMQLPDVRVNGEGKRLPGILNLSFGGVGGEALTLMCDVNGIAVSSGSACHAGDERPSHVLTAMGVPERYVGSALRISLGWNTHEEDADGIISAVTEVVNTIRAMG